MSSRRYSYVHYAREITRSIWAHPANREHRSAALARALGWQVYKRTVRRPRDIDYAGYRLRCYPNSNSASNVFYFGTYYDWQEMQFLRRYLRPGDGFIDIGANIGTYTLLAASLIGTDGYIDAFEPSPVAAGRLRETVALNNLRNVRVHDTAIGNTIGMTEFSIAWDVSNGIYTPTGRYRTAPRVKVAIAPLDDALADRPYAAAKLDVEGVEVDALRGAAAHLEADNPPVWQIEVLKNQLRRFGTSVKDLFTLLRDYGYEVFVYDSARTELIRDRDAVRAATDVIAISRRALPRVTARINGD